MKTATKEKPILFSGPMVRAILDGRKTQTRRIAKNDLGVCDACWLDAVPHNFSDGFASMGIKPEEFTPYLRVAHCEHNDVMGGRPPAPWSPGDKLWVREKWAYFGGHEYMYQRERSQVIYAATWDTDARKPAWKIDGKPLGDDRWRPSIHMPRWASRLTLEIESVRVERVQEISEEDAKAEGVDAQSPQFPMFRTYRYGFETLWNRVNGHGAWERNDFVWALTFKVVEGRR